MFLDIFSALLSLGTAAVWILTARGELPPLVGGLDAELQDGHGLVETVSPSEAKLPHLDQRLGEDRPRHLRLADAPVDEHDRRLDDLEAPPHRPEL